MLKVKKILTEIMSKNSGQNYEKTLADMERNNRMSSEEALKYGIVDKIIK